MTTTREGEAGGKRPCIWCGNGAPKYGPCPHCVAYSEARERILDDCTADPAPYPFLSPEESAEVSR